MDGKKTPLCCCITNIFQQTSILYNKKKYPNSHQKPFFTHSKLVLSSCSQFHAERKTSVSSVISQRSNNLRGQETSDSVGGRKSMCQIQATGAMEQQQIRLDIIASPAAGPCFGTRSNAMSTQTPGHLREFRKIVKEGPSMSRIFKDFHTRTSYEHPIRTLIQAPMQSICKILMQGIARADFNRIF